MANNMVTIKCYGEEKKMSREAAKKLYFEAMIFSEGSEQARYVSIYTQLVAGLNICTDE